MISGSSVASMISAPSPSASATAGGGAGRGRARLASASDSPGSVSEVCMLGEGPMAKKMRFGRIAAVPTPGR